MSAVNDTIVAISTPTGTGAIGVIRLSGPAALQVVGRHCPKVVADSPGNTVVVDRFRVGEQVLDEVVCTVFRAPRSYTGEDVVEIGFHGSAYILQTALQALIDSGARLAQAGEFTQRAFFFGRIDLSQAEAVADLIASESEAEHRLAMHQMRGGFSQEIAQLRQELIDFASLLELELDFSEEDVEFANREQLNALLIRIRGYIGRLIESFRFGNAVKQGIPVAIIGRPNAGKSTLLNRLLNDERAIVSDIAGTTRDTIEDQCIIEGIRFRFIDTAGIRDTADTIERIGVERALETMRRANVVIYLQDARDDAASHADFLEPVREELRTAGTHLLHVYNKADLITDEQRTAMADTADSTDGTDGTNTLLISAKNATDIDRLRHTLVNLVRDERFHSGDVIVTNTRHLEALRRSDHSLASALDGLHSGLSSDLVAPNIREALHHLGSITGEITTDDLLGNIFGRFCIGK